MHFIDSWGTWGTWGTWGKEWSRVNTVVTVLCPTPLCNARQQLTAELVLSEYCYHGESCPYHLQYMAKDLLKPPFGAILPKMSFWREVGAWPLPKHMVKY